MVLRANLTVNSLCITVLIACAFAGSTVYAQSPFPVPEPTKTGEKTTSAVLPQNSLLVHIPAGKYYKAYMFTVSSKAEYDMWLCCESEMKILDAWLSFMDGGHQPNETMAVKKYSLTEFVNANKGIIPNYLQSIPTCPSAGEYWFDFGTGQVNILYCSLAAHTGFRKKARNPSDTDPSRIRIGDKKPVAENTKRTPDDKKPSTSTPEGTLKCKQQLKMFQKAWSLWRTQEGYDVPDRKNPAVKSTLDKLAEFGSVNKLTCPDYGHYDFGTADIPPSCSLHSVSLADGFDYPVGEGNVAEHLSPEPNDLYPNGTHYHDARNGTD